MNNKLNYKIFILIWILLIFTGCTEKNKYVENTTNEIFLTAEIYKDFSNTDWEKITKSSYEQIKNILEDRTFEIIAREAYRKKHPELGLCFVSGETEYNTFDYNYKLGINSNDIFVVNKFNQYVGYTSPTGEDLNIPNGPDGILDSFFMVRAKSNIFNNVIIPESIKYIEDGVGFRCQNVFVDEKNEIYADIDGVLCNKNKDILLYYPENRKTEKYILPQSIKYVETESFNGVNIKELILSNNISEIQPWTFVYADIDVLEIPSNVKKIKHQGFLFSNIKNIKFNPGLEEIEEKAFEHCEQIEEINLPEGLKKLGAKAFNYCSNLKKIYIPKSVESIDGILYDIQNDFENEAIIYVEMNSYAEKYVKEKGYKFEYYTNDTDLW